MANSKEFPTMLHPHIMTRLILLLCLAVSTVAYADSSPDPNGASCFGNLRASLINDGFDSKEIEAIFTSTDMVFDAEGTGLFFVHNESILNYDRFANRTSIHRAKKYIEKHHDYFSTIEKKFGVDKTVITAIILVETGLGTYLGKRKVITTLSTMASLSDPDVREHLWNSLDTEKRLEREAFDAKADKKSAWAYEELKAFLRYSKREKLDPFSVNGSYAGALGIAQFMPSNILFFAQDGNKDGTVDMFDHKDAIASIANYLRHYGWDSDMNDEKARKVLYAYNHSGYYVNILMKISSLLKGENG